MLVCQHLDRTPEVYMNTEKIKGYKVSQILHAHLLDKIGVNQINLNLLTRT